MKIEQIAEAGLGFLLGYVLGFLLKKALKIALVIIAAVIIVNVIIHGDSSIAGNTKELDQLKDSAGKFIVKNKSILDKIRDFLAAHTVTAIAFVAGLITGLLRG